jgi:hypothetical protein
MKSELERARTLAKHHNYMCIEVYSTEWWRFQMMVRQ